MTRTLLIAALAVLMAGSAAAETASAALFDGRIDDDARLYRRSYATSTTANSRPARNRQRCPRSRSLLGIFGSPELTTGANGATFPGLINGDCPISAGILKVRSSGNSPFGSLDF